MILKIISHVWNLSFLVALNYLGIFLKKWLPFYILFVNPSVEYKKNESGVLSSSDA
jgi:hypothetical protein